tara:strand:- start:111 stop:353 length:243 start_codon:yes stop_codon:yes gene_type:complete
MKVTAEVTIGNGTYEDWLEFFKSYESERNKFVSNEVIQKESTNSAVVTFDIVNLEGLTKLSSRDDILETEKQMQITTEIK